MIPEFVRGAIAPTFTAFDEDGRLDDAGQRNLLDFMLDRGGVNAFFLRSGMGQMYAFDYEEAKQLTRNVCAHLEGKAPVLIGAAGIWDRNFDRRPGPEIFTQQAIELSLYAEEQGASGVVHTMPMAIAPKPGETHADVILRYFETINDAVSGPVFIYQPPGTPDEYCLTVELAQRLAEMDRITGIKISTADAHIILNICWATMDMDFAYIVGNEMAFYAGLAAGARASIGQGCTMNPHIINAVQDRFEAGDLRGALDAQRSVNYLCEVGNNPVAFFKMYVNEKGYPIKPHARDMSNNPYMQNAKPLTREQYESFKRVFEAETEKYAPAGTAA